jgi:nitrite reductase (NADH) large subunit
MRLPIPGANLRGVLTFRDLADVASLARAARHNKRAAVIGGGLLGIEAAYGLAKAGVKVTLVHLMDRLMERQLDARAAAMLKRALEAGGIEVLLEAATTRFIGKRNVEALELRDGRILAADMAVISAGVQPNAEIAAAAGLAVNRGIVVDDHLATSAADLFAIGECAEHRGTCCGLVEPVHQQASVLAGRLSGRDFRYSASVTAANLKVSGVRVFSAGDFFGGPDTELIVLTDPGLETYKKLVIRRGALIGAVLYGDTVDARWYLELIRSAAPIEEFRDELIFGRAMAERRAA